MVVEVQSLLIGEQQRSHRNDEQRKGSVDAAVVRSISYTYWRAHPELACVEPGYADVRAIFEEEDQGCEHGEAGTAGSAAPERDTGGRAAARRMSG